MTHNPRFSRYQLLKGGAVGAGFFALGGAGLLSAGTVAQGVRQFNGASASADSLYIEAWPTSPLIKTPFVDPLPIPQALRPVAATVWQNWRHWQTGQSIVPGPGRGQQDDMGQTHQLWPSPLQYQGKALPDPLIYEMINVQMGLHTFTSSDVLPITSILQPTVEPFYGSPSAYGGALLREPFSQRWSPSTGALQPTVEAFYGGALQPTVARFIGFFINLLALSAEDPDGHGE